MNFPNFLYNPDTYFNILKYCIGPLSGAFAGSWLAYKFATRREDQKTKQDRIHSGQVSLFILVCQANSIALFRKQVFDKFRDHSLREYAIQPIHSKDYSDLQIDIKSISFLLFTEHRNTLGEVVNISNYFHSIINTISYRNTLHHEFQQKLERAGVSADMAFGAGINSEVGDRICVSLKKSTDDLYEMLDQYTENITTISEQLAKNLEDLFPNNKFIRFKLN